MRHLPEVKNIEAESTQKEDREVEWGLCAPLYIRGKSVVCHDLFGVCACVDCMPWGGITSGHSQKVS